MTSNTTSTTDDGLARALRALAQGAGERSARAAAALADAADEAGLADIRYAVADSPFGGLLVAVSKRGVVRVAFPEEADRALEDLGRTISPRMLRSDRGTGEVRRELDEYFAGRRRRFEVAVDLTAVHGFTREVLRATARIPFGKVLTYREVAGRAGNPLASRAAGNALHANPIPIVVPCHRVLRTGGALGGYGGGVERKTALLELEGVLA